MMRSLAAGILEGLCLVLVAFSFAPGHVGAADIATQSSGSDHSSPSHTLAATHAAVDTQPPSAPHLKRASFEREHKSRNVQCLADWVMDSGDNSGMPFAIIDKVDAKVFVFDPNGKLLGAAPVLLGLGHGDDTIPGIGDRKLSDIRPEERVTPAGRFVASLGFNFHGKDILWVDYNDALSLHRVVTNNPKERRLERLATQTPLDNRISFGCINVPAEFFDSVVKPTFTATYCIVYILPEIRSISEIFRSYYDVELRWGTGTIQNVNEGARSDVRHKDLGADRRNARP